MIRRAAGRIRRAVTELTDRVRRGDLYRASGTEDVVRHLDQAAQWLARAQDAGGNRGIAYGADVGGSFLESYPETTGYIIPTLLELAPHYDDWSWHDRAIAAADWECAVQMPEGAVMGGMLNRTPSPAVFNTGMVLLGWATLVRTDNHLRSAESARRACDWLLSVQDTDGCWRRGNSRFAIGETTVYNVKAAWGLCEAGYAIGSKAAIDGAIRNAESCLSQQRPNGWFANNCLTDAEHPLLHTTAYVMQGLIGIGRLTGRNDFIDAAERTADALIETMDVAGFIPGRADCNWHPAANWSCLTGSAQTAIVCGQLYRMRGHERHLETLRRLNRYLMRHHDVDNRDLALRGGVPGSWPVWGEYGRLRVLSWATNFFIESLLLEQAIERDLAERRSALSLSTSGVPSPASTPTTPAPTPKAL